MPSRRIRNPRTGEVVDAETVEIVKEENVPVKLTLTDGSVLRLKMDVAEILRLPGETNTHGEPLYLVRSSNTLTLLEPPIDYVP